MENLKPCLSTRSPSSGNENQPISATRPTTAITTGGLTAAPRCAASAAPAYLGNPQLVDPEEAFIASLSSCHMLTFLAIASRKRLVVESYIDEATGWLEKNASGGLAITRVVLRPRVVFSGDKSPSPEELAQLHDQAHHACFIANSVKTEVSVESR